MPAWSGAVHRLVRETQRRYFGPPSFVANSTPRSTRNNGGRRTCRSSAPPPPATPGAMTPKGNPSRAEVDGEAHAYSRDGAHDRHRAAAHRQAPQPAPRSAAFLRRSCGLSPDRLTVSPVSVACPVAAPARRWRGACRRRDGGARGRARVARCRDAVRYRSPVAPRCWRVRRDFEALAVTRSPTRATLSHARHVAGGGAAVAREVANVEICIPFMGF